MVVYCYCHERFRLSIWMLPGFLSLYCHTCFFGKYLHHRNKKMAAGSYVNKQHLVVLHQGGRQIQMIRICKICSLIQKYFHCPVKKLVICLAKHRYKESCNSKYIFSISANIFLSVPIQLAYLCKYCSLLYKKSSSLVSYLDTYMSLVLRYSNYIKIEKEKDRIGNTCS